jgi:tRNA1Val (adenine37-N6)-methyltransferase
MAPAADDTVFSPADDFTEDALLRGRVRMFQPRIGYRTSLDPVLLAGFVTPPFGRFLDVGCGNGVVSFLLLDRDPAASGVGIEVQARLARLAERGAAANRLGARFSLVCGDARTRPAAIAGPFDLVVTNPPFRSIDGGPPSPDPERARANHEVSLTLSDWVRLAATVLRRDGVLAAIFPFVRRDELLDRIHAEGLFPSRSRSCVPRSGDAPSRLLIEARARPCPLRIEPPLVLHAGEGYGPEVRRMLGES